MLQQIIKQTTIITSLQHNHIDVCKKMLLAAYDAGVRIFEYKAIDVFDATLFTELKAYANIYAEEMLLGIGSIHNEKEAEAVLELEPAFISSAIFSVDILDKAYYNQVIYIPGVFTPTEAYNAVEAGCKLIQIFPGSAATIELVKAMQIIMPSAQLIITEGIAPNKEAIELWKEAGVTGIVLGNNVFADWDYDIVKNRLKNIMY
jgi:2-dehydro-3-deoxyphosphogluconate aldolase / (4S)-4-hydroxy-2-oxoglutarate aldolase